MEKTKNCPYCGEEIPVDAVKCSHCKEWLDDGNKPQVAINTQKNKSIVWIVSGIIAVIAIIVFILTQTGGKSGKNGASDSRSISYDNIITWNIPDGFTISENGYDEEGDWYFTIEGNMNGKGGAVGVSVAKVEDIDEFTEEDRIAAFYEGLSQEYLDEFVGNDGALKYTMPPFTRVPSWNRYQITENAERPFSGYIIDNKEKITVKGFGKSVIYKDLILDYTVIGENQDVIYYLRDFTTVTDGITNERIQSGQYESLELYPIYSLDEPPAPPEAPAR